MTIFKKFTGLLLTAAVMILYAFIWISAGIFFALREFWQWGREFYTSVTAPDYIPPIGMGSFYARQDYARKAARLAADSDYDEAVIYWKKAAALYDVNAMIKLGEHCHHDYYAIAAGFGSEKAASLYADAAGQQLTEEEKKWFRRNFLKLGTILQDQ